MDRERSRKKQEKIPIREQIRNHKGSFFVYIFLRLSVVLVMIAQVFNRDYYNVFLCALTLILFTGPSFIERNWHIDIPDTLEIIVLLMIYSAEILGEIRSYYVNVPGWDTALHTMTGFLAAAVGFSLVDILNSNDQFKFNLSPVYLAICAFCFSMTIGILWEFFEFSMDFFLHMDMQKDTVLNAIYSVELDPTKTNKVIAITGITDTVVNGRSLGLGGYLDIGLYDTMKDLFVNFIGAVVFSVIGFFYVKHKGAGRFAKRFIPTVMKDDEESAHS